MTKLLQIDHPILSLRLATVDDIDNIVRLVESAYRGEQSKQGWTTEAYYIDGQRTDRQEVSELLTRPGSVFILCFDDSQLLGSVQVQKKESSAYLGMFAVSPLEQSRGIGSQLLEAAEKFVACKWRCDSIKMLVITIRHELIAWYQKKGYQKSGIVEPFPYYEPRFGLPTRDDLKMETMTKQLSCH